MKEISILAAPVEQTLTDSRDRYSIGYNLISILAKEFGVKFHVITNVAKIQENLENVRIYEIRNNLDSLVKKKLILKYHYAKYAKEILRKEKISIIHQMTTFAYTTGFSFLPILHLTEDYPFIIGPAEARHLIFEDEYDILSTSHRSIKKLEYWAGKNLYPLATSYLFKKTLHDCDILIAVNNETKKLFSKYISAKKIRVIPIGIHSNDFPYSPPPNNHEILVVGNLIKRKGHEYLIKAMSKFLKDFPDAMLHIVGDGPRRNYLEVLTKRLNLERNIIFHGFVSKEELLSLYKNCRVFCHPSLSEGFCHVTLEAMATGRPVVSTDNFGSKMVEHGKTGFLVPPGDSEAIADAILKVLDDYELTYNMGIKARKKIEEEYDWHKVAEKYYGVYQEVIG